MKFPLSQSPFSNYPALTGTQVDQIQQVVEMTLSETLAEYSIHHRKQRRLLPRSQYKVVKKAENLICYKQRSGIVTSPQTIPALQSRTNCSTPSASASTSYSARSENSGATWNVPELMTVGTVEGTVDDVLYGLMAPDATSSFIRASYTGEELLDAELLHCIEKPTTKNPFQFCSVKWHVLGLTKIAAKRDFVFVEASGTVIAANGERIGYHIMHSVDLPGLGELSEQYQVTRARVVSCHLFRQLRNGSVDVYMKGSVDPSGHMPESVAVASTVSTLLKLGQATECSYSKKLEHFLERSQIKRSSGGCRSSGAARSSSSKSCAVCLTTLHMFRSVAHCELCSRPMCSRCRVSRRLSYRVARPKELKEQNTTFCTSCVATATNYSAVDVVRAELKAAHASLRKDSLKTDQSIGQLRTFLSNTTVSSNNTVLSSSCIRLETPVEEESTQRRSFIVDNSEVRVRRRSVTHPPQPKDKLADLDLSVNLSVVSSSSDYLNEEMCDAGRRKTQPPNAFSDLPELAGDVNPLACSMPPKPSKPSAPAMNSQLRQRRELLQRMTQLQQNAESTYRLT